MNYQETVNYLKVKSAHYQNWFINRLADKYNLTQETELKLRGALVN